ncbi:MAG: OsmC family protein [Candidatus Omnitrophota bacterium]
MKTNIEFVGKKKFKTRVRKHEVITDLPGIKGGDDTAPTPPELLIVSLGTCVGYFVLGYLETVKLDASGFSVDLDWEMSEDRTRISKVAVSIKIPNAKLGNRKRAVIAVAKKCIIHQTLHHCPEITTSVSSAD